MHIGPCRKKSATQRKQLEQLSAHGFVLWHLLTYTSTSLHMYSLRWKSVALKENIRKRKWIALIPEYAPQSLSQFLLLGQTDEAKKGDTMLKRIYWFKKKKKEKQECILKLSTNKHKQAQTPSTNTKHNTWWSSLIRATFVTQETLAMTQHMLLDHWSCFVVHSTIKLWCGWFYFAFFF